MPIDFELLALPLALESPPEGVPLFTIYVVAARMPFCGHGKDPIKGTYGHAH